MAAIYPKTMCQLVKLDYINYLNKMNLLHIKPWPTDMSWFTSQACYECVRCTLERACPKGIEHSMIPGQCRHGRYAEGTKPQPQRLENKDPFKKWKETADKESFEQILLENQTNKELSVSSTHYLKKVLMELVNTALGLIVEAAQRKVGYVHWAENVVTMAIFKEIFAEHMQVKAIKVELRPFGKTSADPKVVTSTAYLRMPIIGHVKHWVVHPMEDLREMSFTQINKSLEVDNWMITVYGQDVGAEPAPSMPSSRPRRIPAQLSTTTRRC